MGGFVWFFGFSNLLKTQEISQTWIYVWEIRFPAQMLQRAVVFRVVPLLLVRIGRLDCITLCWEYKVRNERRKSSLCESPFIQKGRVSHSEHLQHCCEILRPPISLTMGRGRSRAGRASVQCTSRCIPNSPQRRGLLGKTQPNDHYFQEHK